MPMVIHGRQVYKNPPALASARKSRQLCELIMTKLGTHKEIGARVGLGKKMEIV